MRKLLNVIIALEVLLLIAVPTYVAADDTITIVNADGFVASGSYYVSAANGGLYTRVAKQWQDWVPGYYTYSACCKVWVAGYWGPTYTTYEYVPAQINLRAKNAEEQLIDAFKARDAGVLAIAKEQKRLEGLGMLSDKLGLNANIANYGAGIFPLANYGGTLQTSTTGAVGSGNTVYGYSTLTLEAKGADLNALLQMYGQAVRDSQLYGDNANARLAGTVNSLVEQSERIRQTLATGSAISQAAQGVGKAVNPGTDVKLRTETKLPQQQPDATPRADVPEVKFLQQTGPAQCVRCHAGDAPAKVKFDITTYDPDTADQKLIDKVMNYITSKETDVGCGINSKRTQVVPSQYSQFLPKKR